MAGSLESVLASIPGYGGYRAAEQNAQQRQMGELAQVHTLQGILAQIQQQELMQKFSGAMAGGGGSPEQLDAVALRLAASGHPGAPSISALADKRRKQAADVATLKTIQSPAPAPVQSAPDPEGLKMVADMGAAPAMIPGTNFTNPTAEQVPAADRPAFDKVLNEARAKNAAARGDGGLFSTLMQSEIPAIANQAKLFQQQANASDPRSVSPTHWIDLQKQLASQEATWLERRNASQTRVDTRAPLSDLGKLKADLDAGRISQADYDSVVGKKTGKQPESNLSRDAIEQAAARYALDGSLPPNLGRGAQGSVNTGLILNRAAEQAKESGDAPEAARLRQIANKASSQALGQLVKQKNMVLAFEKNAVMNADLALQASEQVDRLGSPVFDRWMQAGKKNIAGDVGVAKLDTAIRTFVNEYARVTTSVTGGGVTSDSARREIDELLRGSMTKEQVRGVIQQMKLEMENRRHGYEQQEAELKRGITGVGAPPPIPKEPGTPPGTTMPKRIKFDAQGNQVPG